jgi:hypothetical protein
MPSAKVVLAKLLVDECPSGIRPNRLLQRMNRNIEPRNGV